VIEGSTIRGYIELNFGYNAKREVYANSSSDIPELYAMRLIKRGQHAR
jgi:hypothetical protein